MSSPEPVEFQRLFCVLSGEEDGSAFYHKNYAAHFKPILDPVKHILASAAGKLEVGARFTNDFPTIQILCKFRLAVIPFLAIRSYKMFAHTMTAKLSCYVQNFVAITVLKSR